MSGVRSGRWFLTVSVISALLIGGAAPAVADGDAPSPSPSASDTAAPSEPTPSPSESASPSPTVTPAPEPTPTPSAAPEPIESPTDAAQPTGATAPLLPKAPAAVSSQSRLAVTPFLLPGATPTASLSIQKAANTRVVEPGQTFTYTLQFQCTAGAVNGCVNAELRDALPAYLTITGPLTVTGTPNYDSSASTSTTIDVRLTDNLGGGQIGLLPGRVITVQVPVRADASIPVAEDGTILTNAATISADNATQKTAKADVTLRVDPTVDAVTTKSIDPRGGPNDTTTRTNVSVIGSNTSNVPVTQLVISDPALEDDGTPPTVGNPFSYLTFAGAPTITAPAGADQAVMRVYDSSVPGWVEGVPVAVPGQPLPPANVALADVTGYQIVFTDLDGGGIAPGATATVDTAVRLKAIIPDDQLAIVITNTADTTVTTADGTTKKSDPASASYRVPPSTLEVAASKSFSPDTVHAGDSTTATVTGTNASLTDPLDSMTITEPSATAANHFEDGSWLFTSIGSPEGQGIVWPAGASSATITYRCAAVPAAPQTTLDLNTLPSPPAGCSPVTGFSVTFTGVIEPGAQATIPFVIATDPNQTDDDLTQTNTVEVHGERSGSSGDATAVAPIRTITDRLKVETTKSIYPSTIPSLPGAFVTASLTGRVLPFPDSTVDATRIIVQDPSDFSDPSWYDAFDPQSVTATPIPACASLTVQYTTNAGQSWSDVPGMTGVQGARIYSAVFPDDVGAAATGIRFVYAAAPAGGPCTGGFPPGTSVSPNLAFTLDTDAPNEQLASLTNCAATTGSSATTADATSPEACDDLDFTPVDPGSIDPVSKTWDIPSVPERSQTQAGNTIHWSTSGYSGLSRVEITDSQSPAATPIAGSVFDTFDLASIGITAEQDPLLTYDQITKIELFRVPAGSTNPATGSWVEATDDPCRASGCDGRFPGYTLTADERATSLGYRLTYVESPTRSDRLDSPQAPPVGSGVATSTGNNREVHAVFQLRDARRSDPNTPVTSEQIYNTGADSGVVTNTVRLDAYWNVTDPAPIISRTASAPIVITNVPITATSSKTWAGGPLGIPQAGIPQSAYPTSRVTLVGSNTAPRKVDVLRITDPDTSDEGPSSCRTSPFDAFNLVGFTAIAAPGSIGADDVTVALSPAPAVPTTGGRPPGTYTRSEALGLSESALTGVTSMVITYTGRINAASTAVPATPVSATVTFDVRLRATDRTTGDAPAPGVVCNASRTDVTDLADYPGFTPETATSFADAGISLAAQGITVAAGKSFTPTTITEPSRGPTTVSLSGRPGGQSRAVQMTLEDSSPTFFNQYDFTAFSTLSFTSPINRVRVDAYSGGTWSVVGGVPTLTGGSWKTGLISASTTLALPVGVTAPEVQGLRFTFSKADGSNWENPANPLQTVRFTAARRDTLNTGGPVTSDLAGNTPAPGESAPGTATNETTASVTSSDVDAQGQPLTASDSVTSTIRYVHATNSVQVRKSPNGGSVIPATAFRYTITATNNGGVAITNPVFTDVFPTDGEGPQIVLDSDPGYAFTESGGTGMPTDPADVTIQASATGIVFSFPTGSTLPVDASYTISFSVRARPGLAANTSFTNSVGVTGDRPWDACDGGAGGGLDPATGECRAIATNSVVEAGALTVTKAVRAAGSDVLGVTLDPLAPRIGSCRADADGFYTRPCRPIGIPGGALDWRLNLVNAGNLPLDRILAIDRLPAPGDAVATAPGLERGSQWQPLLSGTRPAIAGAGAGTYRVFYTTASSGWCDGPQATDDTLLCPELDWIEWPEGQRLPVAAAEVTGLQFEWVPTTPLAPATGFTIDISMLSPAQSPADLANTTGMSASDSYAYNSVGSEARVVLREGHVYTLTTEPSRVGAGLAHGGLHVVKRLDGADAAALAPATFEVSLSCVSAGRNVALPADIARLTLAPGVPVTIYDLPYGATCTLSEGDYGQTSSSSTSATVRRDIAEFDTAALTNRYDSTSGESPSTALPSTGGAGPAWWAAIAGVLMAMIGLLIVLIARARRRS